jgi:hypothetical protein
VHCAGGRHRTGVMGAVYRFNHYNWNYDQAYAEMKKYDFYTRWGHGDMKKFVQDYAATSSARQISRCEGRGANNCFTKQRRQSSKRRKAPTDLSLCGFYLSCDWLLCSFVAIDTGTSSSSSDPTQSPEHSAHRSPECQH